MINECPVLLTANTHGESEEQPIKRPRIKEDVVSTFDSGRYDSAAAAARVCLFLGTLPHRESKMDE